MNIVSDGYSARDVAYVWTHGNGKSIKMASDMTLSQFDLVGIPANNETAKRPGGKNIALSSNIGLRKRKIMPDVHTFLQNFIDYQCNWNIAEQISVNLVSLNV